MNEYKKKEPKKGEVYFECNLKDNLTYDDIDRYKR